MEASNPEKGSKDTQSVDEFNRNRDEYLQALELSVGVLQEEVEQLRSETNNRSKGGGETSDISSFLGKVYDLLQKSVTSNEIIIGLQKICSEEFKISESNVFQLNPQSNYFPIGSATDELINSFRHLEEEGILDWVISNQSAALVPDLTISSESSAANLIVIPLRIRDKFFGLFVAVASSGKEDFPDSAMKTLSAAAKNTAVALDNINSAAEISEMNKRLGGLNSEMMKSSGFVSIGKFAASVADEINSPVQIIDANLKLIEAGIDDGPRRIQIIRRECDKISNICVGLKHWSDDSASADKLSNVNLCEMIDDILLFRASHMISNNIKIEKNFSDVFVTVAASKLKLEQAVMNIITNAGESMPEGGVVKVGVYKNEQNKALLTVSDTGIGIHQDNIKDVFEPQYSTKPENKSAGYGLFSAKKIIEQYKGSVSIISEQGQGTTVKIEIPVFERK